MDILSIFARAVGVGLAIWLLNRAIRTAHPLDRAGSILRWSVVTLSALLYGVSLVSKHYLPMRLLVPVIFAFTLFFFLPDVSYYIVLGIRRLLARGR